MAHVGRTSRGHAPGAAPAREEPLTASGIPDVVPELAEQSAPGRTTSFEGRGAVPGTSAYRGLRIFAAPGLHEHVAELARRHLEPGASVCDLGSGTGALALRLADQGYQVTATDLVADNFGAGDSVEFVTADLEGDFLAEHRGRYDAIFAVEILEHVENPRRFLRQARELLAPGGTLIVTTPNTASPVSKARFLVTGRFQWFTDRDRRDLGHLSPISPWLLTDALAGAGFSDFSIGSFGDARESLRGWWKLLALARVFRVLARSSGDPQGDLLVATAHLARVPALV